MHSDINRGLKPVGNPANGQLEAMSMRLTTANAQTVCPQDRRSRKDLRTVRLKGLDRLLDVAGMELQPRATGS